MEQTSEEQHTSPQVEEEDLEDEIHLDGGDDKIVDASNPLTAAGEHFMSDLTSSSSISTQDLVLAAITVMKGRKARPDTKRLCNWVHRKYGRSIQEVVQEIDLLCVQGILDKVEYKGSISFRIVSERKLHKRAGRRKSSPPNSCQYISEVMVKSEPTTPTFKKTNKKVTAESPDKLEKNEPLTVNLIVAEELRPEQGDTISKGEIIRAIELSSRPINKKAVMRDLETILAQEIHLGYLIRYGEDSFCLPQLETARNYRGTITPKVSRRKAKPTHKILEMENEQLSKARQDKLEEEKLLLDQVKKEIMDSKTEDQLKDDLIKEKLISNKLFKMRSKMKMTKIKLKKEKTAEKDEAQISKAVKLENVELKLSNIVNVKEGRLSEEETKSSSTKEDSITKKSKKMKEAWQVSDLKDKSEMLTEVKEKVNNGHIKIVEKPKPFIIKEAIANETIEDKTSKKAKTSLKQLHKNSKLNNGNFSLGDIEENGNDSIVLFRNDEAKQIRNDEAKQIYKDPKKGRKRLRKKEEVASDSKELNEEHKTNNDNDETSQMPDLIPARASSGRKKRARKIFDPADHDLPARVIKKCRVSTSPPPPVQEADFVKETPCVKEKSPVKETAKVKENPLVKETNPAKEKPPVKVAPSAKEKVKVNPSPRKRGGAGSRRKEKVMYDQEPENCLYCDQGDKKNEKLVSCKDCRTTVHPSCLNYPEDLTDRIYSQPWQCLNCKTCFVCNKAGNDDQLLFCDSCDLGYHMPCHKPEISSKPVGRWECAACAISTGWVPPQPPEPEPPSLEQEFEADLPPLPPGTGGSWQGIGGGHGLFCPPPDLHGPVHWEDAPLDPNIPDISGWSAARVSQYLVQNGIQEIYAKVFFDEEIDGRSVLLMARSDIITRLGIKLGPALKIYNRIKRLQTRRELIF